MDKKGNVLVNRVYKTEIYEEVVEKFFRQLLSMNSKTYSPFLIDSQNGIVFTFQSHKNLICKIKSSAH